jgi:ELWxxDGT repeat protein
MSRLLYSGRPCRTARPARPRGRRCAGPRLSVEFLEDRTVPSTIGAFAALRDGGNLAQNSVAGVPGLVAVTNGELFFASADGAIDDGFAATDGKSIQGPLVNPPSEMTVVNGTLFYVQQANSQLLKNTGSVLAPTLVKDFPVQAPPDCAFFGLFCSPGASLAPPAHLTAVGSKLFFTVGDADHGTELWKSDGSEAGTVMVKDINPGNAGSVPDALANVNGKLFFVADDGGHGRELWVSDGTSGGTHLVKDIVQGSGGSFPFGLTNVNGKLFFAVADEQNGIELWKSDGTSGGTALVKVLNAHPTRSTSLPAEFTNLNGQLVFTADDGSHGDELWVSDGTSSGTRLLKDIAPGGEASGSAPAHLTNVSGTVYFSADDGSHGRELWKTNGKSGGTALVSDINPAGDSGPTSLLAVGGTVYFGADDGSHGQELWSSDGTAAGTRLVLDVVPGPDGSSAAPLGAVNGTVFFGANDGSHRLQLWRLLDATMTVPGDQASAEGDQVSLRASASSKVLPPTLSVTGLPPGASFNPVTGALGGQLSLQAGRSDPYVVTVTAHFGPFETVRTFNWTVDDLTTPSLTNLGDQTNQEGDTVHFHVGSADADGDALTYTASNLPPGLSLDPKTGDITGTLTATAGRHSPYTVVVTVTDGENLNSVLFTWTVTTRAPAVTNPGPQTSTEGKRVVLTLTASDPAGRPLTFTAANLPPGLGLNARTGAVTGTLGPQSAGSYAVAVTVSNGLASTEVDFTWTVTDITAPVVVSPGNQSNAVGDRVALQVSASDSDRDPLTYQASGLPDGLSIDATTGVISGVLTAWSATPAQHKVLVVVSDGSSKRVVIFLWTVSQVSTF